MSATATNDTAQVDARPAPLAVHPVLDTTTAVSDLHSPTGVGYHGRVRLSGWVMKHTSRMRVRLVRRYFRLNNSQLSNAHDETSDPTWVISVSNSVVRSQEERFLITLRLADRELRFQLDSFEATAEWLGALRRASRCNIADFYHLGAQLGFGSFGAVRFATDVATGATRAVKIVERSANKKEQEFLTREIAVMLSVSHPNLVRTHDIFDEDNQIFCVMDYIEGGDLFDYIANRPPGLPEKTCREITRQMLCAVAYLHSNNIVHRDIKPENVLVKSERPILVQLTDFGFANFVDPTSASPHKDMVSVVGTGCYMSPEVIEGGGHGKPVDIFAVAVVMYKMVTGILPFEGETLKECLNILKASPPVFKNNTRWKRLHTAKDLCEKMLSYNPDDRPTAKQALEHPWFHEHRSLNNNNSPAADDARVQVRTIARMSAESGTNGNNNNIKKDDAVMGGFSLLNATSAPEFGAGALESFDDTNVKMGSRMM